MGERVKLGFRFQKDESTTVGKTAASKDVA